jgi:hypothetical protein
MPKKKRIGGLSAKAESKRRKLVRDQDSSPGQNDEGREQNRMRMGIYRAEKEPEESLEERRQSAQLNTSRLRDLRSRTEQAVPPPPEPTQK